MNLDLRRQRKRSKGRNDVKERRIKTKTAENIKNRA